MRTGRSYIATAVALGIVTLGGCAAESADSAAPKAPAGDWGDPSQHPELGGAFASLTAMAGTCSWNSTTGAFAVVMDDTAQTAVLGVRTVDSQLLVNGKVCAGTAGATSKLVKTVDVSITGAGDAAAQAFVLDFLGGVFAPGVTGKAGITVNLGATSVDTLAIRGSNKADAFVVGAPASGVTPIAFNTDAFADITVKDATVDKLTFSLAEGADTFTAQGGTGFTGVYTGKLTVFGGTGADTIYGGSGNDAIYGGTEGDTLNGGLGDDAILGEADDDIINSIATPDGADTVTCGAGSDKVSYELRTTAVSVTVGTADLVDNTDPSNPVITPVPNDGDIAGSGEKDHVLAGCENIVGGTGNDVLVGDSAANTLTGGKGNDTLQGMAGADTLVGGDGTDTVDYSEKTTATKITLDGVAADDGETASGGEKDWVKVDVENVKGGADADEIVGNDVANEFWPAGGNDKVTGGKGDDIFHEGPDFTAGADGILGGAGSADDVAVVSGSDSYDGGDGTDTIDYSERLAAVSVSLDTSAHATSGNDGTATIAGTGLSRAWTSTESDNIMKTIENVQGGAGDDELLGDLVAPVSPALPISNDIEGNAGDDKINGGYGDDTLSGSAGDDTIYGGAGDDTVEGGAGTNLLDCGDDSDIAYNGTELTPGTITCELLF